MRPLLLAACALCAGLLLASCTSTASLRKLDPTTYAIPTEGTVCKVTRQSLADSGLFLRKESSSAYYGTVIRADPQTVVLSVRMHEGRNRTTPRMPVPVLSRYFENTGVGRSAAEGEEVSIPLNEIAEIARLDPGEPGYALATGASTSLFESIPVAAGPDPAATSPSRQPVPAQAPQSAP